MVLLTAKFNRRQLFLLVFSLFIILQLFSAFSSSYEILVLSRVGIALLHTVFWAVAPPLVYRLAPLGKKETALGLIMIGTGLASTLGIPLGTFVGKYLGWRSAFVLIAMISLLLLILLFFTLPSSPSQNTSLMKSFKPVLTSPVVLSCYIILGLIITGHFTAYTYIEPFLKEIAHLSDPFIVIALLISGLGGVVGGIVYPKCFNYGSYLNIISLILLCLSLVLLQSIGAYPWMLLIHLFMCSISLNLLALQLQTTVIREASTHSDLAIAIFSGVFNVGIGLGALVGGKAQESYDLSMIGYVGGIFILMAIIYYVAFWTVSLYQLKKVN
ncbi:MAG: MFS transporter [Neisseriaceae bacterium]|nr:MFS transporter [Neisseriaceae bacterium]